MTLNPQEREYLAGLVRDSTRRTEKSLRKIESQEYVRKPGQSEGDFQEFTDALRSKLMFQQFILSLLEDDEAWDDDGEEDLGDVL